MGGIGYFLFCWLVFVPTLLIRSSEQLPLGESLDQLSGGAELLLILVMLALIPFLWRPAQRTSDLLIRRGRGVAAGLTSAAAISATALSVLGPLLMIIGII